MTPRPRFLVVGVGNADRGDDAVGLVAAQCLQEACPQYVSIQVQSGESTALMDSWRDADAVILIDAVAADAAPGTIHRFDAHAHSLPSVAWRGSTHAFGVAEAIELARVLRQLPARLVVYGVSGRVFDPGAAMSAAVQQAIPEVVARVRHDLTGWLAEHRL